MPRPKPINLPDNVIPTIDPELIDSVTEALETSKKQPTAQSSVFPTEFYRSAGIAFCSVCGEALRTNLDNEPICPINLNSCERR